MTRMVASLSALILSIVLLVQPHYLGSLLDDSAGQMVLVISISMWTAGILWLFKLVKPQV